MALLQIKLHWPESTPLDHINTNFFQQMLNRLAFGFHNYGHSSKVFPHKRTGLDNLAHRIKQYKKTKNTEFLIDAANMCMFEFMYPSIKGTFYEPTGSQESPGGLNRDGTINKGEAGKKHG